MMILYYRDESLFLSDTSHAAKRIEGYRGVAVIASDEERVAILKQMAVTDVWGIGSRLGKKLEFMGKLKFLLTLRL